MMVFQSMVLKCEKAPRPWQDPVLTPSAVESLVQIGNTYLWAYVEKDISKGHVVVRSDGFDWEILTIWVQPQDRDKGVGKALLGTVIENAKQSNIQKIFLEVRPSNTLALRLYKFFGFQQISNRINYYTAPVEDAAILELDLSL